MHETELSDRNKMCHLEASLKTKNNTARVEHVLLTWRRVGGHWYGPEAMLPSKVKSWALRYPRSQNDELSKELKFHEVVHIK